MDPALSQELALAAVLHLGEPVEIRALDISLRGIFSRRPTNMDLEDGGVISGQLPVVVVLNEDLPSSHRPPAVGWCVTVRGQDWTVTDTRFDGFACWELALQVATGRGHGHRL